MAGPQGFRQRLQPRSAQALQNRLPVSTMNQGLESLRQMANIPTHRLPQEQRTMKNIMRDMEGYTRSNMENYFFENEGDTSMYQLGEMRPPAFSGSVGTQVRPYDYGGTMFPSIELDNDEGIASLPEGKMEPDLETMLPNAARTPMTDDQKDYLYDYMIDFMMKQKQREQREMEGRIPPFNYEGLEV